MSLNIPEAREAIVDTLLGAIGSAVDVYTNVPTQPTLLPCIVVYPPDSIDYRVTKGRDRGVFSVLLFATQQDPTWQETIEKMLSGTGSYSIVAALTADPTLGGVVLSTKVLDMTTGIYALNTGASDNVIGCELRIEIEQ